MQLPTNCSYQYPIRIMIREITAEMLLWTTIQGGAVRLDPSRTYGKPWYQIGFGKGKFSHHLSDNNILVHFNQADSPLALMFILMYNDVIISHNMEGMPNDTQVTI